MSYKAGFVGLVGLPNAGKSTLVNSIVGEKVGIVTRKPQTTRQRVNGIYTDDEAQLILVDSPGHIEASRGLNRFLQDELQSVIEESDGLLLVLNLDASKRDELEKMLEMVRQSGKPFRVFINKTDLGLDHRLLQLRRLLEGKGITPIEGAARKKRDFLMNELLPELKKLVPDSPGPLYTKDLFTTQSSREWVVELIREKCFEYLHQEIPYGLAVRVVRFDESSPMLKIDCEIIVSKDNHRAMVVGQGASTLKRIGSSARHELEKYLERKVYLNLHVKAKRNWVKNDKIMEELGYVVSL